MIAQPQTLQILKYPNAALRQVAQPIEAVDEQVQALARRMVELMHEAEGVGLAGPQVGLNWRIFVANPHNIESQDRVFINPVLSVQANETHTATEGCLSLPEIEGQITRPASVHIHALDENGEEFDLQSAEMPARVWQHETDHLDGVLIIDKMPRPDRLDNRRLLREMERNAK